MELTAQMSENAMATVQCSAGRMPTCAVKTTMNDTVQLSSSVLTATSHAGTQINIAKLIQCNLENTSQMLIVEVTAWLPLLTES